MIARAAGSTQHQMQKLQTTAGGETLSFDYTFDIPVEVAAAVCKYRHDRWKFEWSKPQFTRLDVAIGSICEILRASRCFPVRLQTQTLLDAIGTFAFVPNAKVFSLAWGTACRGYNES
jgi:hypothetical protein